ncbi:PPR domain-containing protein/PPR_2 domain-containing protein [Cephalotus follicularis]|uniref:PPR domain-containing protein/PPR_2 domain-containing protein n=1 Tax=Cephalotus follicularis TaxID=3775 RepID=A0A1Q3AQW1_CEPFO|nr:PPR domain-containing protein/PPR_2 domain-containing protein [Cephalotus follicularis]
MLHCTLLAALEACKSMKQALQVHAQIILNGIQHHTFPISRLISFFALSAENGLSHSRILFSQIDCPNVFIWNTIIRGYSRINSSQEALAFYMSMLATGTEPPNNFTFPFVLNACARLTSLEPGFQIHCHVIKFGFEMDLFVKNALIHFYSVFGHLDNARYIFEASLVKDVVSYNTMLNGYAHQVKQPHAALLLFRDMQDFGIQPDEFTFVALLSTCSVMNDPNIGKQIHALTYKKLGAVELNVLLTSAILDMYTKCGLMNIAACVFSTMRSAGTAAWSSMVSGYAQCGDTKMARCLFDRMDERDIVSWTAMISGYSQAGQCNEALELFVQMERLGIKPDEVTLVSVLSACAGLGALDYGKRLHHQYVKDDLFAQNIILTTAIIEMYAKCGCMETALDTFRGTEVSSRTNILFNSMISCLAQHGLGRTAVNVFGEMEIAGLKPDRVTFVAVLCACSHSGLVEEGKDLFRSMLNTYRIKPQMEHFGCLVDLLGRDGRLNEAYDLIQSMPFEANSVIWRGLLGACRLHGNAEMGDVAGQYLLELEPEHGARFVLLSDMLANTNQWEEAGRVRKMMQDKGIQKPPGWSYIELNGSLHRFLASDKSHPQAKEIELTLKGITMQLKFAGHVPDTAPVVFDIR